MKKIVRLTTRLSLRREASNNHIMGSLTMLGFTKKSRKLLMVGGQVGEVLWLVLFVTSVGDLVIRVVNAILK